MPRRFLSPVALLSLLTLSIAWAGEAPFPGRYQIPAKTKGATLLAVWGQPEQSPAFGHTSAITPDGKTGIYATGGGTSADGATEDSSLGLWDVSSGRLLKEVKVPAMAVTALALTADAKFAVTGLIKIDAKAKETIQLILWDMESGKEAKNFGEQKGAITAVAIRADGKAALVAALNDAVSLLDLQGGKVTARLETPKKGSPVFGLAFHPDSDKALSSLGNDIVLWDLGKKAEIRRLKGHKDIVFMVALSKDGKRAASSGGDASVRLWDVDEGLEVGALVKKESANQASISIALADDGKNVLALWTGLDAAAGGQPQAELTLWDGSAKKTLWSRKSHFKGLAPIVLTGDGKEAIVGGGANFFSRWKLAEGVETKTWGGHKGAINALVVDAAGNVYSGSQDGTIKVWIKGKEAMTLDGHGDAINALALSKDGQFLLSGSADKSVKLWDAGKGRLIKTFNGHTGNVTGVAISPDFQWIASGSNDRTVKIWDIVSGKEIQSLGGHAEGINGIALSGDSSWLASASDDNTVRLWPLKDGKSDPDRDPVVLEEHKRQVNCVVFSGDGTRLLSGSQDKTLMIWDVSKGKLLKKLDGHKNWVSSVALIKGGALAASTSDDLTVRLWDIMKGEEIGQIDLSPNSDCPRCVTFSEGRNLIVGTSGWVILRCAMDQGKKK